MFLSEFKARRFLIIVLLSSIWIHISEVFRYFVFVIPRVQSFFDYRDGIAAMNWTIFGIWAFWDMLLTTILVIVFWLCKQAIGQQKQAILVSANLVWVAVFVIFWVAAANMGLSEWRLLFITLPLSWFEMMVGAFIVSKLYAIKK